MKDFTCDRCRKSKDFDEMAYIGAPNPKDTACSPFMRMLHICHDCWTGDDARKLEAGLPIE